MGKHENSSPKHGRLKKSGWLSGMLHVFDFHHWMRTKNRPICWKTPRTHSLMRETEEQEPFLDSKMLSVVADDKTTRPETKVKKMMSTKQVTEYVDFLEILRKEDVFVKIMKDQVEIKSNPRVLPKSGSFPVSGSSSSRPAKIEHKQKENWYAPRQSSTVLTLNVPRVSSQEHKPLKGRFREIKKVIKNVLKDRNTTKKKRKKKVSDVDYVGRYSQLLEHSFRREVGELRSKSLKIDSRDNKPQFFRRISSLSSLEVLGSFLTDLPRDQDTNLGSKKPLVSTEKEERYEVQEERSQKNHLDIPNQQDPDSVPGTDIPQKTETLGYNHEEEEDVYFSYVKKALEVSDNGEKWYTEEQPLNPSLLNELEIQEEEAVNNKELLFDLVNEAIVETQNQTHTYFPKTCPYKNRYLDEVWGRFKWNISGLGDENRDRSLDDIVGRDLRKADGWMNLRGDSEWLTLELEDLIFDDVLVELLCVY